MVDSGVFKKGKKNGVVQNLQNFTSRHARLHFEATRLDHTESKLNLDP